MPKHPLDELEPEAPHHGGVETVVLSMTENREAIEAIYTLAMTVRLNPEPHDLDATTGAMCAELGLSARMLQLQLRSSLTMMTEVYEGAQVGMLLRLYQAQRLEAVTAADAQPTARPPARFRINGKAAGERSGAAMVG